jgi:hypothetical protein
MCGGVEPLQPADAVSVGAAQGAHSGISLQASLSCSGFVRRAMFQLRTVGAGHTAAAACCFLDFLSVVEWCVDALHTDKIEI